MRASASSIRRYDAHKLIRLQRKAALDPLEVQAQRVFESFISSLSVPDIMNLLDCTSKPPAVYIFDHSAKSVSRPKVGKILWPYVYVLTCFSRKHLFLPKQQDLKPVYNALARWQSSLRWKFHFRVNPSSNSVWNKIKPNPKGAFNPCRFHAPEVVETFISRAAERILAHCKMGESRPKPWARHYLVSWILRALKGSEVAWVPSDKDAGFVLTEKRMIEPLLVNAMKSEFYTPISAVESRLEEACVEYCSLAKKLGKDLLDEGFGLPGALCSGLRLWGHSGLLSRISLTLKSHKEPGNVGPRIIHCSSKNPFMAAHRLIIQILTPKLDCLPFLVKNTEALIRRANSAAISPDTVFYKMDVKDFYMSGAHDVLAEHCASLCSTQNDSHLVRSLVLFILREQYVSVGKNWWRVRKGAGMGMPCAGHIADAAYVREVEEPLLSEITSDFMPLYVRFRDDVLIALNGDLASREGFIQKYMSISPSFEVNHERRTD